MAMFDPAHPGELIRETIEGLREETGKSLTIEEVAKGLRRRWPGCCVAWDQSRLNQRSSAGWNTGYAPVPAHS